MGTRIAWKVLHDRAVHDLEAAQARVAAARRQLDTAEDRVARLDAMRTDYLTRLIACQEQAHLIEQATTLRRFIAQIDTLRQRAAAEVHGARAVLAVQRQALATAERDRVKYASLIDRDERETLRVSRLAEQRLLDAQALARFNLNRT